MTTDNTSQLYVAYFTYLQGSNIVNLWQTSWFSVILINLKKLIIIKVLRQEKATVQKNLRSNFQTKTVHCQVWTNS